AAAPNIPGGCSSRVPLDHPPDLAFPARVIDIPDRGRLQRATAAGTLCDLVHGLRHRNVADFVQQSVDTIPPVALAVIAAHLDSSDQVGEHRPGPAAAKRLR